MYTFRIDKVIRELIGRRRLSQIVVNFVFRI